VTTKSPKKKSTPPKKNTTIELSNTELEHLRNVMSIILPSEDGVTVSAALARLTKMPKAEASLWKKLVAACKSSGVNLETRAPDFAVVPTAPPPMDIILLES
jgi:hypothetical protein